MPKCIISMLSASVIPSKWRYHCRRDIFRARIHARTHTRARAYPLLAMLPTKTETHVPRVRLQNVDGFFHTLPFVVHACLCRSHICLPRKRRGKNRQHAVHLLLLKLDPI